MASLVKRLSAAVGTGEIVRVRYHGGSQPGAVRDLLIRSVRDEHIYAVCLESQALKSFRIDRMELAEQAPLTYAGRGYASEAVRAMVDAVFNLTEARAVTANSRVNNPASRRVLEKCGFTDVVCSPLEAEAIRQHHDFDRLQLNTPGVRLPGSDARDQARTDTPAGALRFADRVVIGSDITDKKKGAPAENLARIVANIQSAA